MGGFWQRLLLALAGEYEPPVIVIYAGKEDDEDDRAIVEDDDVYEDLYSDVMSNDNPYLSEIATGFVYKTLSSALIAHWPHVLLDPSLAASSVENAVIGATELFTDDDLDAACGVLFETGRWLASNLDPECSAEEMEILGAWDTEREAFTIDADLSDKIKATVSAFLDEEFMEAMGHARLAVDRWQEVERAQGEDLTTWDAYRNVTVTLLLVGARQWAKDEFPEFLGVIAHGDDD